MKKEEKSNDKEKNIDLYLSLFKDEYNLEDKIRSNLELKASIMIFINGIIVVFFLLNIILNLSFNIGNSSFGVILFEFVKFAMIVVIILFTMVSFYKYYLIINFPVNKTMDYSSYISKLELKNKNLKKEVLKKKYEVIDIVKSTNSIKNSYYKSAFKFNMLCILLMVVYCVLRLF